VTLDTTRADHLGSYGYAAARTRRLDQLAAEGVRFERAYASAPITLPAHASLFTGLYPFEHGVRNNGNFYLADRYATLATTLHGQGYQTGAFVSAFVLDRRYGLARGFDVYDDRMEGAQRQVLTLEAERRGDRTALALSRWLETTAADRPVFAWLHLYDPHEPYAPPGPFRDAVPGSPYDGEIAFADAALASILDKLRGLGRLERTLVAVVADHGESLGEHGEETHSMFVYESAIRIPFLLWRPGRLPAGKVVTEPVRGIDLTPTLLDILGAPPLTTRHGRSLLPLILGEGVGEAPPAHAETLLPQFYMNWAPLRTLVDQRYKLIDAPRPELYDLQQDPGETRNLYASQPDTAKALRGELDRLTAGSDGAMSVSSLDREALEKLSALGYIGAGHEAPTSGTPSRVDPKDVIGVFNRLRRANGAVRDRRFAEALPILKDVLRDDPRNAFAQLVLGSAYMGLGQFPKAIAQFRTYLTLVPTSSYAHLWMAICHLNTGARSEALREADAALALDAKFTDARVLRAGVLATEGRHAEAIAELRSAVATDPAKAMVRLDLAKVLAEAGQRDAARHEYDAILAKEPDYAPALVGRGALRAQAGDAAGAEQDLRRALEIDPQQEDARRNLARLRMLPSRK
jgi:arylsulfatase A-like enzyme/Tfp pilus assembly protein PilF